MNLNWQKAERDGTPATLCIRHVHSTYFDGKALHSSHNNPTHCGNWFPTLWSTKSSQTALHSGHNNKTGNVALRITNIQECSRNACCRGKAINITHSEYSSVSSVIQHAKHMRHIILSSVPCPFLQYFPTLSYKRHDFLKKEKYRPWNFCFDFLYNLSKKFSILKKNDRNNAVNVYRCSRKVSVILVRF